MNPISNGKTTLDKQEVNLEIGENFATLDEKCTQTHLATLSKMLRFLPRLVYDQMPDAGGGNPYLQEYMLRVANTIDALATKNRLEVAMLDEAVRSYCAIDPTESGFPVIVRDFHLLENDKEKAAEMLKSLPTDEKLVRDALFTLFRGVYPEDVVLRKLQRDYFQMLKDTELAEPLKSYAEVYVKKTGTAHFLKKSLERLDENNNLPRFYTVYFNVTPHIYNSADWRNELESRIISGLSSVSAYELPTMAKKIEDIDGITLQMLERFDIGPFYNKNTTNPEAIDTLLDQAHESNGILAFRRYFVQRMDETAKQGLIKRFKGYISGDMYSGIFSPVIQSPKFMLMPQRLIQRAYNLSPDFKDEVKLFGITAGGDFLG